MGAFRNVFLRSIITLIYQIQLRRFEEETPTMKVSFSIILTALWTLVGAQQAAPSGNIAEIASSLPDFSTLVSLVTLNDANIQPVLARLTGATPTSKCKLLLTTASTSIC